MTLYQIVSYIKAHPEWSTIIVLSLIQISPIKFDPWTWICKNLSKWFFGGLNARIDNIEARMDKRDSEEAERNARSSRRSILRAADEIYSGQRHSKEYFEEILAYCDEYDRYCQTHPNFRNGKTHAAEKRIREVYERCLSEHDFL